MGLDIEGIDRLYLNLYQPRLQTGGGVVGFFKGHRGAQVASTTLMAPMTREFAAAVQAFAKREGVEIVRFEKGQRKDDQTQRRLKSFNAGEGVLYIGVAQERCSTFRVTKRFSERTGISFPWLYRSTVMCNHYYFYLVDADFGPLFIKFSGYFPYTARACLNGHEYAKCQLRRAGIAFEALSTTACTAATTRGVCNRSPTRSMPRASRRWCASGWRVCRSRSRRPIVPPATTTTSPSCRRNSRAHRCSTARWPGGICSRRSSARISTSAAPSRSA
ncbi:hypothetical protein [Thiohalocapsa halophila]|uniref:hypothetical protein n=1 Tax=Thiohalocapsa halophila TaxID=69359 RepID=UPI0019046A0F|nr:hypothetical protein [Thiohalocapsa halophila]